MGELVDERELLERGQIRVTIHRDDEFLCLAVVEPGHLLTVEVGVEAGEVGVGIEYPERDQEQRIPLYLIRVEFLGKHGPHPGGELAGGDRHDVGR